MKQLSFMDFNNEIVLKNQNLIYKVLQDMGLYEKREDYFDIGLIAMFSACDKYDPTISTLSNFFYRAIKNAIINQLKLEKKDILNQSITLSTLESMTPLTSDNTTTNYLDYIPDKSPKVEDMISVNLDLNSIVYVLNKVTTKKNKQIFCEYFGIGCVEQYPDELADKYNCSIQYINSIIATTLEKIKQYPYLYNILEERNDENVCL